MPHLRRSRDRVIAGVCGGIAERFGWPANRVRIAYVLNCDDLRMAVDVLQAALERYRQERGAPGEQVPAPAHAG